MKLKQIRGADGQSILVPADQVQAAKDVRAGDPKSWLDAIWGALAGYREDCIPEGEEAYDEEWSDICTAMAWIAEELGVEESTHG